MVMHNYRIEDFKELRGKKLRSKYCFQYRSELYLANTLDGIRKKAISISALHYGPQLRIHIYTTNGTRIGIVSKDHGNYMWWKQDKSAYYMLFHFWVIKENGTLGKPMGEWEYTPKEAREMGL